MLQKIAELLSGYEGRIYQDLEKIVNINSFSTNLAGIRQMHDALQGIAAALGVRLESLDSQEKTRPHLLYGGAAEKDYYAFMGHFDTVHPPESDFNRMWEEEGLLRGPGTNDMKSGLIVALYTLAILQRLFPDRTLPVKALFNSDEEIGSPDSEAIMREIFVGAKAGLVFEPGRLQGNSVVTERKGIINAEVTVIGRPAHSGTAPWSGVNAIVEAAHLVLALEALNNDGEGISVGCNLIKGGTAVNVVAPECTLQVDIRYRNSSQKKMLLQSIERLLSVPKHPEASIHYRILHDRPPMPKTEASQALYRSYRAVSESLGIACGEISSGGGSDANILADMGIPVIDGVGAVGNFSHTTKEYTIKQSIPDRIKVCALFMAKEIAEA